MRSGSSQRGNERFARETLARVRRLAADATVTVRSDAGFFSYDMIAAIGAHGASYSITIPQNAKVKAAIAATGDDAWQAIAYTRGGEAQGSAETGHRVPAGALQADERLWGGGCATCRPPGAWPRPPRLRWAPDRSRRRL